MCESKVELWQNNFFTLTLWTFDHQTKVHSNKVMFHPFLYNIYYSFPIYSFKSLNFTGDSRIFLSLKSWQKGEKIPPLHLRSSMYLYTIYKILDFSFKTAALSQVFISTVLDRPESLRHMEEKKGCRFAGCLQKAPENILEQQKRRCKQIPDGSLLSGGEYFLIFLQTFAAISPQN